MTHKQVQAGVGTAHLSPDTDEDGKYVIHGVALGAGDVTVGSSGTKKKWPAEELEEAAHTLEGKPLVKDHENSTDGTVGTVTKAFYREGVGVLYEGKIAPHYEQLAKDIASGILEVSARAYHAPVDELEEDDQSGALVVQNIKFDNLSVVSQGASPSNSVDIGKATAMAQGPSGESVAVMEAGSPRPDAAELRKEFETEDESESEEEVEADADTESDEEELDDNEEQDEEELASPSWHKPDWSGTNSSEEWDGLSMEDFDTDDLSEIDDHFIVSKTGSFPPENFGDLALEVVAPNGDLTLGGLDSAYKMAGNVEGVSDEMANKIQSKIKSWAESNFDVDWSDRSAEESEAGHEDGSEEEELNEGDSEDVVEADADTTSSDEEELEDDGSDEEPRTVTIAATTDDDPTNRASTGGIAALTVRNTNTTMTDEVNYEDASEDAIDEMDDPVVMEKEDVESLESKAGRADQLDDKLDDVNSTLDELADKQNTLDEVDEDALEELQSHDEPVIISEEEHEELQGLVDDVGQVFADELADYSPFSSEELMDRFTPMELKEKVDDHEDASISSELGQSEEDAEPEGGSASKEELEEAQESTADDGDSPSEEDIRNALAEELESDGLTKQAEEVRDGTIGLDELGVSEEYLD